MAIIRQEIVDGGPHIQANGQYRGILEFEFDDGRIVRQNLRAADSAAWATLLTEIGQKVQAGQAKRDSYSGVSGSVEITANKQANIKERAVAYLRTAIQEKDAHSAYLLLDRFNTYRLAQGWTLPQVQTNLASAGLTQEEWDQIRTIYQYLSSAGRPAIMADYKTIQDQWEAR